MRLFPNFIRVLFECFVDTDDVAGGAVIRDQTYRTVVGGSGTDFDLAGVAKRLPRMVTSFEFPTKWVGRWPYGFDRRFGIAVGVDTKPGHDGQVFFGGWPRCRRGGFKRREGGFGCLQ